MWTSPHRCAPVGRSTWLFDVPPYCRLLVYVAKPFSKHAEAHAFCDTRMPWLTRLSHACLRLMHTTFDVNSTVNTLSNGTFETVNPFEQYSHVAYRLNGTARRESMANCLPEGLPYPSSTREQSSGVLHALRVEIDALEKKLQDSSKVRQAFLVLTSLHHTLHHTWANTSLLYGATLMLRGLAE